MSGRCHRIGGNWIGGAGPELSSVDPATGGVVWRGRAATVEEVDQAVAAARGAFGPWAALTLDERMPYLEAYGQHLKDHREDLAGTISEETGKPLWESLGEVDGMVAKIALARQAHAERCGFETLELPGGIGGIRHRPHGVIAVLGPFNMPAHLPHGQIVPALIAGNTVVFKPSELTPGVGQKMIESWQAIGLPPGALNLVQGGGETGRAVTAHDGIDGLFFIGSYETGRSIHRAFGGHPEKILALEMGGNNPLVVWNPADPEAAAVLALLSAYITAGQRCTCARRLIVPAGSEGERIVDRLVTRIEKIRVGPPTDRPEPFMGPVISAEAAERLLEEQADLVRRGGKPIVEMQRLPAGSALLGPGLIDVTEIRDRPDAEIFGPLLQLIRVPDFETALDEANRTAYGLSAGILTDDRDLWERFLVGVRAGVVHWNRQTTGASGRLPFGGVGRSGNHRPSGYHTPDYCSYPAATIEVPELGVGPSLPPGLGDT